MFGAASDKAPGIPEDRQPPWHVPAIPGEARPAGYAGRSGLRGWLTCALLHRRVHRWYPRYLGGYGCCSACGREWE